MNNENTSYYPPNYLKLIVEDAAIEITCHAYCQEYVNECIKDCGQDIVEYLTNSIDDKDNFMIYINFINELKEYCLMIIETEWGDTEAYENHIDFITLFINDYKKDKPIIIDVIELPFRNKISFDMQKKILHLKFKNELIFWNRYKFIINHTECLLYYLDKKKQQSIYHNY